MKTKTEAVHCNIDCPKIFLNILKCICMASLSEPKFIVLQAVPSSSAELGPLNGITEVPLLRKNSAGIVHFPKSRSLHTVLSGPHVDKKSREQFEIIRRQVRLEFQLEQAQAELFFNLLKNMYLTGCQLSVRIRTESFLFPTQDVSPSWEMTWVGEIVDYRLDRFELQSQNETQDVAPFWDNVCVFCSFWSSDIVNCRLKSFHLKVGPLWIEVTQPTDRYDHSSLLLLHLCCKHLHRTFALWDSLWPIMICVRNLSTRICLDLNRVKIIFGSLTFLMSSVGCYHY